MPFVERDGASIYYEDHGRASQPAVLVDVGTFVPFTGGELVNPTALIFTPAAVPEPSAFVLAGTGADLTITNESHPACQSAFRQAGFLVGPSNYLVGLSKAISDQASNGAIHITRGDGDGPIHL